MVCCFICMLLRQNAEVSKSDALLPIGRCFNNMVFFFSLDEQTGFIYSADLSLQI